ncbi:MAG: 5'-3' exonuclease [Actinomycetota bacterium]
MTTFLLDAPSLVYRAFFSYPTSVTDERGNPVNAVRGFMEMVTRLIIDRRPDRLVAVFDSNFRPDFRVAAYPGYKAQRPEDPPELPRQFHVLAEVLDAAGIERVESAGLEADDAIATLVGQIDGEIVIVTGDRDLLALVRDPDVKALFPVKGTKEMTEFAEADIEAKYGVPPRLYPQLATLRGDPSDGLPGISGIGPKRAVALLTKHGSVETILEHLHELPPRQRDAFDEGRAYLEAMKTVVGLVTDAPIDATDAHPPEEGWLAELKEVHNLGGSATRLSQALKGER